MKCADIIVFAGQSNMAGRGIVSDRFPQKAPSCIAGAGFEYRAVSAPNELFDLSEPFGVDENRESGISEPEKKTGGLVTAFVNAYYSHDGRVPVVGVSAAKGGSSATQWQPDAPQGYLPDAIERFKACRHYLVGSGYAVRHNYLVWCQGETDGDHGTGREEYFKMTDNIFRDFLDAGIEHIFMIQIGQCNIPGAYDRYDAVMAWQKEFCELTDSVTLVSESFKNMRERGLMRDEFHYYQQAYNEVGTEAGINTAGYDRINNILYHPEYVRYQNEIDICESDRKFCRHGQDHALDVARLMYIEYLEKNSGSTRKDKDIIYAAALLHDIGRAMEYANLSDSHDEASALLAGKILPECGFSKEETDIICNAILGHRGTETGDHSGDKCYGIKEHDKMEELGKMLKRADKLCRPCYSCPAEPECKWNPSKKNRKIYY